MRAVIKRPGAPAEAVCIPNTNDQICNILGGKFQAAPILRGAQVLTLAEEKELAYNTTFLGYRYCGPILIVGRGENECLTSLSESIQKMTLAALNVKER